MTPPYAYIQLIQAFFSSFKRTRFGSKRSHAKKESKEDRKKMGSFSENSEFENPRFFIEEEEEEEEEEETIEISEDRRWSFNENNNDRNEITEAKKKKKSQVYLEGYVDEEDQEQGGLKGVSRTVSLTDDDLDELKGCLDLGFGFNYEEIPELCNTLPALELCYSMSQKFLDEHHKSPVASADGSSAALSTETCSPSPSTASAGPIANWKISSPGDHPEEVKARLKFWAQAVACTVRLCS